MAKSSSSSTSEIIKPLAAEEALKKFIEGVILVGNEDFTVRMAMNNEEALPLPPTALIYLIHTKSIALNSHELKGDMINSFNVFIRTYSIMFFGNGQDIMAADMAETFCMAFNDKTLYEKWKGLPFKPLYANFSEIVPMVNSEDQYNDRCDVILKIENNKNIKFPQ